VEVVLRCVIQPYARLVILRQSSSRLDLGWRWPIGLGLFAAAITHVIPAEQHLEEAPAWGVLFVLFVIAATGVGALVLGHDSTVAYIAALGLAAMALLTFVTSRVVALPGIADDVRNWSDGWGTASIVIEAFTAALAGIALRLTRHRETAGDR
jgi:hypothetical protein